LTSEFGVPSSKIAVFPMPFDFSFFSPVTKSEISETKKVLTVGRLIELKGHSYLIEAIQILKKRGLKIKLILIGEGPRRRLLDAKIQSLGLEREVEVLGFRSREELNYFYNWCDVFVLPSITDSIGGEEGLGVVLLEAGSCKKPVIGTLSGGIPDVIKNNETGLLVPEKDSQALADAIEKVLKDEKLRNRLAENRYKYVRENFTLPKIAEKMANIYQKALKMH
jgi:glycosyltransferase involved in cell wall biosynthesis